MYKTMLSYLQAHAIGGKIYLVGGLDGANQPMFSVDEYDPLLDVYKNGPVFAQKQFRLRYGSGKDDKNIYVAGGLESNDGAQLVRGVASGLGTALPGSPWLLVDAVDAELRDYVAIA
jgi:hypothetical protein